LNEQNPDRGIETSHWLIRALGGRSLNEQNPDRGIETGLPSFPNLARPLA